MIWPVVSRWLSRLLGPSQPRRELDAGPATFVWQLEGLGGSRLHAQEYELWLWEPLTRSKPRSRRIIRWLKSPLDRIQPLEPLAVLGDDRELMVLAPPGLSGRLLAHLAPAGTAVTNGQPLASIIADELGAFEPAATYVSGSPMETTIIATLMSPSHISKLATIGALTFVGLATTIAAMIAFIMVGGLVPPIIATIAMALVTACLRLGEYLMKEPGGEPS